MSPALLCISPVCKICNFSVSSVNILRNNCSVLISTFLSAQGKLFQSRITDGKKRTEVLSGTWINTLKIICIPQSVIRNSVWVEEQDMIDIGEQYSWIYKKALCFCLLESNSSQPISSVSFCMDASFVSPVTTRAGLIVFFFSIYSRTSMARTPLGLWKFVRDRDSSS